jgi:tetratricopeptide (TPR) repeat protein
LTVVTVRTYSNPAEAAMAKSLLDDHKIFCSLADENVNLYGGGPLAMPIRLMVAEEQAEEAARILDTKGPELSEDFDPGSAIEMPKQKEDINQQLLSEVRGLRHTNQWIVLIAIAVFATTAYLVIELPQRVTSPWSAITQATRRYDYERAISSTKKLIAEHPEDYYGYEYLGNIYFQMGKLNEAEAEYSRAYQLAPPEHLKAKIEEVRKRIEREARTQPSATPIPWP